LILKDVLRLIHDARRSSARSVNSIMTATYWQIGHRIVEFEQQGKMRAAYGIQIIDRLSADLSKMLGRGFSQMNLRHMRRFYELWPVARIQQTVSVESRGERTKPSWHLPVGKNGQHRGRAAVILEESRKISQSRDPGSRPGGVAGQGGVGELTGGFPLPWSHYVRLLSVEGPDARAFYESEALRGGWSTRQLDRQINSRYYERVLLSRNKAALLHKGSLRSQSDHVSPEEEIKDPLVLEFLDLKDEYSENQFEETLIRKIEQTLLELGNAFAFVARQRRLRIGDEWYRVDLLLFNRNLRCLVVVDLKLGKFTHADAGQMHMYLNYAREHWKLPGENPPVGLILCSRKDETVAKYALDGLPNKVIASEYKMALPPEKKLASALEQTRRQLEAHARERRHGKH
jgi:predicted nuclease of restriction endonuclease-like (RecB) superfamily